MSRNRIRLLELDSVSVPAYVARMPTHTEPPSFDKTLTDQEAVLASEVERLRFENQELKTELDSVRNQLTDLDREVYELRCDMKDWIRDLEEREDR